jgi:predicted dehydrogenase
MRPSIPLRVFAQLRGNIWSSDCDDFARVCIEFDNSAVALVEINTTTTAPLPRWHIDGTNGSAQSPHSAEFDTRVWSKLSFRAAANPQEPVALRPAPCGLSESDIWRQFAAACRGDSPPAVLADSVLPTMAILDAARHSSRTATVVALHP